MASAIYKKWDILLVDLNPVKGSEITKIRPCLVVSPNSVNTYMNTIIVGPFTSKPRGFPFRINTLHNGIPGELCFDHLKSIDKSRIVKKEGTLEVSLRSSVNALLTEFFNE